MGCRSSTISPMMSGSSSAENPASPLGAFAVSTSSSFRSWRIFSMRGFIAENFTPLIRGGAFRSRRGSHAGVCQLVGTRDQLHVDGFRQVGLPVIGGAGKENQTEKNVREHCADGYGSEHAAAPAFRRCAGLARWKRQLQRVLRRADCYALHACGAFDRANLNELVNRQFRPGMPWRICRSRRRLPDRAGS